MPIQPSSPMRTGTRSEPSKTAQRRRPRAGSAMPERLVATLSGGPSPLPRLRVRNDKGEKGTAQERPVSAKLVCEPRQGWGRCTPLCPSVDCRGSRMPTERLGSFSADVPGRRADDAGGPQYAGLAAAVPERSAIFADRDKHWRAWHTFDGRQARPRMPVSSDDSPAQAPSR